MLIPRRDVELGLDPSVVPRDWCGDDGYRTTFLNALSLLFPEGEKFFVESVKQHQHLVTDPELSRAIVGFIGQEAMHCQEHRSLNDLLVSHGYAEPPALDRGLQVFLKSVRKTLSPPSQLAATC